MNEAKGIVWTTIPYKNYRLNITVRDGGKEEALDSLTAMIAIIDEYVEPEAESVPERTPSVGGQDLGLLEYPPKAGDRVSGDVYEITVNEYTNDGAKIQFYRGGEYPLHTHYLGEYGNKVMAEVFVPEWIEHFPIVVDRTPITGGDLILNILVSDKLNKKDNPYVNLVNQRRP